MTQPKWSISDKAMRWFAFAAVWVACAFGNALIPGIVVTCFFAMAGFEELMEKRN